MTDEGMQHRFARVLVATTLLVTAALVVSPPGGASPSPGPDNPWLQRRIAAVAHAGGEDENPQETLYAYGRAAEAGVPVLDLDVQLSADGVPVVIHDATVDRTTSGTGPVASHTAAELQALDAAHWYTADCSACHDRPESDYVYRGVRTGAVAPPAGYVADDFGVPTLEQVFERFDDAYFSIEIKDSSADVTRLAERTAELIHRFGLSDRTLVSSFGGPGMPAFRAAAPDVATSATLDEVTDFFISGTVPPDVQVLDVPPLYDLDGTMITVVSPDFVRRAHEAGMAVWVWMNTKSQQTAEFYTELLDMGVDGLNVSRPALLMEVLARRGDAWDPDTPLTTTTTAPMAPTDPVEPVEPSPATAVRGMPAYTG